MKKSYFERLIRRHRMKLLPRRVACFITGGHRWGESDAVIIDGPIDLPVRERDWHVLAFHKQCNLCYEVEDVPFTEKEAADAIEAEIKSEEAEW